MLDLRFLAVAVCAAGCIGSELDLDVASQALAHDNGVGLNGVRLNGVRLNGVSLNGVRLNGVRLNGVRLNGVRLDGSTLTATEAGGPVPDGELVGSQWPGELSDGTELSVRLDAIDRGTGDHADVTIYHVSYPTAAGWVDPCDGAGALAVGGTWSYEQGTPQGGSYRPNASAFTLACRGFAIAKCVELGYKPWLERAAHLAACTRALRADFCGDGTTYTVDGTTINLHDRDGVQLDEAAWPLEARWSANGATCIDESEATRFFQVAAAIPPCADTLPTCRAGWQGGLVTTELPPLGD